MERPNSQKANSRDVELPSGKFSSVLNNMISNRFCCFCGISIARMRIVYKAPCFTFSLIIILSLKKTRRSAALIVVNSEVI